MSGGHASDPARLELRGEGSGARDVLVRVGAAAPVQVLWFWPRMDGGGDPWSGTLALWGEVELYRAPGGALWLKHVQVTEHLGGVDRDRFAWYRADADGARWEQTRAAPPDGLRLLARAQA